ncbi:MAG: lipoyl protein ligase domain-containing protein [Acidimicrobiales bacterium]
MRPWRLLTDDGVDAGAGLALDEALMIGYGREEPPRPPTLRLYTYRDHCALVGRYQHLGAEVDLDACGAHATSVNRRPTGGGAIIMGAGQLGVAVTTRAPAEERPRQLLERFSEAIVAGLARLGLTARFRGKNDLEVGGRKIAGLGLYLDERGALLFHASILADLDVAFMLEVLNIPAAKLGERAVASVEDRVTTVSRETGRHWDGAGLRHEVAAGFAQALGVELAPGAPTEEERRRAQSLIDLRYGDPAWLHEYSPRLDRTASATARLDAGLVRVYLALHGETIKSVLFTGDFNAVPAPLRSLEESLRWKRLDRSTLERTVHAALDGHPDVGRPEVVVEALCQAGNRLGRTGTAAPVRDGSCYFPEVVTQP